MGEARLLVRLSPPQSEEVEARLRIWVTRAARLVSDYLGSFPVPDMRIDLDLTAGTTVGFGQHFDGRRIRVHVGRDVDAATLRRDWVMIHEMLHAGFPVLPSRHRWMQEGLSTYLETIVLVRAGILDERSMWNRWMRRMRYGLTQPGEGGLDDTPTWGRTYWGGALFWLLADMELLHDSECEQGLHTLMRALRAQGINARAQWSSAQVVAFADQTTQSHVVSQLYDAHARAPGRVDLSRLWAQLGVSRDEAGEIRLDDGAPWAHVRRAMSHP